MRFEKVDNKGYDWIEVGGIEMKILICKNTYTCLCLIYIWVCITTKENKTKNTQKQQQ